MPQTRVNLNTANTDELAQLRMMGHERAERIVSYREQHGPFSSYDELKNISGISEGMIEDIRADTTLGAQTDGGDAGGEEEDEE